MDKFKNFIDSVLSTEVSGSTTLLELISKFSRHIYIVLIFLFILAIVRVIYYDIRTEIRKEGVTDTYLKLLSTRQSFKFRVQEFYYITDKAIIGRDVENQITIQDKFLSSKNSEIYRNDGLYYLKDLNSSNGTYLNGQKIDRDIELRNGDIINVGQLEFLFVEADS